MVYTDAVPYAGEQHETKLWETNYNNQKRQNIPSPEFHFSDTAVRLSETPAEHANTTILITNTSGVILAQRPKE